MNPTTLREMLERFEAKVSTGEIYDCCDNEIWEQILDFITSEIERARREVKEECLACVPTNLVWTAGMMVQIEQDLIRERINSIK